MTKSTLPFSGTAALLVLTGVLAHAAPAEAGGLFLTDRGVRPMGRGFAFVAGADDPQSIWYNPAGLSWSGQQLLLDASLTFLRGDFTRIDSGGNTLPTVDLSAPPIPIPMIAYSHPLRDDLVLGVGIYAPNASLLSWPRGVQASGGTCDATTQEGFDDPNCSAAPQRYSLFTLEGSLFLNVNASLAWKPTDNFSIGVGVPVLIGSFVGETSISACDGLACSQPEDPEWDGVTRFSLSPIIAPGISLGLTYATDVVRIGASMVWHPRAIRGEAELDVRLPGAPIFDGARVDGNKADLELSLPVILRAGVEVRPTPSLRIEAALVWEHWASQTAAKITPKNVWIRDAIAIGDYQVGPIDIPRNMNDVFSVRLGGEFTTLEDRLQIRAGVNYENSSFDDAYLTPLTLDSSKFIVGLGASVRLKDGLWLDVSYAHVFLQDRQVRDSAVPQANPIRPPRTPDRPPTEGGVAYIGNGDYNMEADIVGLGIRWSIGTAAAPVEEAPEPVEEVEEVVEAPAVDSDNDGILDVNDTCPQTPRGATVDADGCLVMTEVAMVLPDVQFLSGSNDLVGDAFAILEHVGTSLTRHPEVRIRISGHTDGQGSSRNNLRLSQQRANTVRDWLVSQFQIDASRLEAIGLGESQPVAENDTEEGRSQNRRIEFQRIAD